MTYYFISFDQARFEEFPERFSALSDGVWVNSEEDLKNILETEDDARCFFIDFSKNTKEIDKWVMTIRGASPDAKIIYVTGDQKPQDLKAHQLSPVGGDAYISRQVSAENLQRILAGFSNELSNVRGNKLEDSGAHSVAEQFEMSSLIHLKEHDLSRELDELFAEAIPQQEQRPKFQSIANFAESEDDESGEPMTDKDQEFSLDDMEELEISETPDLPDESSDDQGLDMELDSGVDLELGDDADLKDPDQLENLGELDLGEVEDFSLESTSSSTNQAATQAEAEEEPSGLFLSEDEDSEKLDFSLDGGDLSPDVKDKLAEIDAIMDEDSKVNHGLPVELSLAEDESEPDLGIGKPEAPEAEADSLDFGGIDDSLSERTEDDNEVSINLADEGFVIADVPAAAGEETLDSDLDQPLVSEDLDLGNLDFGTEASSEEEAAVAAAPVREEKTSTKIKRKKEPKEEKEESQAVEAQRPMGQELREISGAYSAELERMQATLSNLRSDREELLAKIQTMEEEKLMHNRQTLTMRAELDEKKIELSIVRKKLNEDISELKDRLRMEEERRLILEEKNRILREELDKSAQKNRIDVKKVQLRERELEGKLELLKSDAETQIRNRDLKILELKRKIDAMEFDMESIQTQEKRTVESRFELEDKLEKAIKTLRGAISVLEDETDKGAALEALKKNIDM
jgi:hypothetical protein